MVNGFLINRNSANSSLSLYDNTVQYNDWTVNYNESLDLKIEYFDDALLVVYGLLIFKNSQFSPLDLKEAILAGKYLDDDYDGQFTIILINKDELYVVTDLINVNKVYYKLDNGNIFISDNLSFFTQISNLELDVNGFFQLLTGNYCSLNFRSPLENVRYFPSGVIAYLNIFSNKLEILDYDYSHLQRKNVNLEELKTYLKLNSEVYAIYFSNLLLPISGGVDSRITLYSFNEITQMAITTMTHGEPNDIEVRLANKLANFLDLKNINISLKSLYPNIYDLNRFLSLGFNLLIGKWLPILEYFKNNPLKNNPIIILGDVFDLLRAKNIKTIRTRKNRILYQLGLFKIDKTKYNLEQAKEIIIEKHKVKCLETISNYNLLFSTFNTSLDDFLKVEIEDINILFDHLITIFNPVNGYELEELFYIHTWGKESMGNQSRILNQINPSYIISGNRKYFKYCLNISFENRLEDVLVHQILRKSKLSNFPTSQIPFVPYKFPIFVKYFLWGMRSFIDQKYMKIAGRIKMKKNRLIETENWQQLYSDELNSENFKSYFKNCETEFQYIINYYEQRANGISHPISDIDLTAAIVPAYLWNKYKNQIE
jgi:hypothetical protein